MQGDLPCRCCGITMIVPGMFLQPDGLIHCPGCTQTYNQRGTKNPPVSETEADTCEGMTDDWAQR
jgi:hypothetical protein